MESYESFIESKRIRDEPSGDTFDGDLNPHLFDFQRAIVRWALFRGRAAVFADTGTGKSLMQLTWANIVAKHTGSNVLILAPLAVAKQTVREAGKFGLQCEYKRDGKPSDCGVTITNYDMLSHFKSEDYGGIVLDESSVLKAFGGVVRKQITEFGGSIQYRLACTATPAPNDLVEITNHAEFLGVMIGREIIALFFTQDGNTTHHWRLKGHARKAFWKWMASWCVAVRMPSDLGYDDGDFVLPPLEYHHHKVMAGEPPEGMLFQVDALTLQERLAARRSSITERVSKCTELVNGSADSWLVWCNLNKESELLRKAIPGSVEVKGSDTREHKEKSLLAFADGKIKVLITKPLIAGHGMNFQVCHEMAFVGLNDSFEQLYQATRRCWRFGQNHKVNVHIITADSEGAVLRNIERKQKQASEMITELVKNMGDLSTVEKAEREEMDYEEKVTTGDDWTMHLGDCIESMDKIESDSVGLSVFSPPFPGMYTYTNSPRDVGNTTEMSELIKHFRFMIAKDKLFRVMMPGRLACVHLCQMTTMKSREGYIGIRDFRGAVIQMFIDEGWVYAGEATIDKNPQVQAVRNNERGLLFKNLSQDSSVMRMALADYLVYFRKPGENTVPIHAGISEKYNTPDGWITEKEWIEWASPVWYRQVKGEKDSGGIRETDVLNVRQARETDDERHLCPLQLGVIERAVKLWSAPRDLVLSPFAGIGSEGYVAIHHNRKFVGIELKESYHKQACANLKEATERGKKQLGLFDKSRSAESDGEK